MKPAILAAAGIAAMLIGYAGGRATAPTKVVEKIKTVEKTIEVAAKTKDETSVTTREADVRTVTRWKIRRVERPDGTVESTATSDLRTDSKTRGRDEETKRETEIRYVDRVVTQETVKVVEADRPMWAVEARIGSTYGRLTQEPPGYGSFVYGGAVERRIIGPVWAGVYASSAGEVGLIGRWEF